ncbi:MAG: hypothetical protein ACTSYA_00485, partial [Candidatus Kariarchaeaceae archaeon]
YMKIMVSKDQILNIIHPFNQVIKNAGLLNWEIIWELKKYFFERYTKLRGSKTNIFYDRENTSIRSILYIEQLYVRYFSNEIIKGKSLTCESPEYAKILLAHERWKERKLRILETKIKGASNAKYIPETLYDIDKYTVNGTHSSDSTHIGVACEYLFQNKLKGVFYTYDYNLIDACNKNLSNFSEKLKVSRPVYHEYWKQKLL